MKKVLLLLLQTLLKNQGDCPSVSHAKIFAKSELTCCPYFYYIKTTNVPYK